MRLLCRTNLEASGYEVIEAADGLEALAAVSAHLPDLIFLDVMMPGLDGFGVAEALFADPVTRTIPIVFVSARVGVLEQARGFELGGVDYLTKPFNPLELDALIRRTLLELGTPAQENRRQTRLRELQAKIGIEGTNTTVSADLHEPGPEPLQ